FKNLKAGPWVALSWWVFGTYKDVHGGLEYYDKTLLHYTPDHPEGLPYSDNMLEYWRTAYINVKMDMFNDVVNNQFDHLNKPKHPKPIPMPRLPEFDLTPKTPEPAKPPEPPKK
ncbi:MAG: hypothetical protein JXN61_08815, partial [Sedimentisphaerales bacterium]|nr:hypothetical protein [Sedimentisphaerales bacterium]